MSPTLGIASLSLGSFEHHTLPSKIAAAAQAGFQHIELFDNDWAAFRDSWSEAQGLSKSTRDGDSTSQFAAAALAGLVRSYGLRISCWQPLRTFEGYVDAEDRHKSRKFARGILDILPILGTRLLLCCTTTTSAPATTGDLDRCAEDLVWLADEAAKCDPPVRVMYEGLSFAAHRSSRQSAWEVVEKANRPNLGICLDSFNTLALGWADPYSSTGRLSPDVDEKLQANMRELVQRVPGHKIFFYQVADGRFMSPPMTPPTDPSIPPIRPWSRGNRLFPFENELGAYLPVSAFSDAVVRTGYDGPWSIEVFNESLSSNDSIVPIEHARRAMKGLSKLMLATRLQNVPFTSLELYETQAPSTLPSLRSTFCLSDFVFIVPTGSHLTAKNTS